MPNNKKISVVLIAGILVLLTCTEVKASAAAVKVGKTKALKISVLGSNKIELNWKKAKNATKYTIYRSSKKNGSYKKIKTVSSCSCRLSSSLAGKQYYKIRAYKVQAGAKTYGAFSAVQSVTLPRTNPSGKKELPVASAPAVPKSTASAPQPPVVIPVENIDNINNAPPKGQYSMFFTVTEISAENIVLSAETNVNGLCYTMKLPENLNVQVGSRLKITNPMIKDSAGNTGSLSICGYTKIAIVREGYWYFQPLYVIERSEEMLYLAESPTQTVSAVLELNVNEILVTKNDQICTVTDIKEGDQLSLFVNSPAAATVPMLLLDCTKICILD